MSETDGSLHPEEFEGNASPNILSIDTATKRRSVAVSQGETVLALQTRGEEGGPAANILGDIDEALRLAGLSLSEIDAFAVALGPGSFTGLRAGIATIQAFSKTLGRPAVGIPTLRALAHAAGPSERLFALIPAGRGEVFFQAFRVGTDGVVEDLSAPAHITPQVLLTEASKVEGELTIAGCGEVSVLDYVAAHADGLDSAMHEAASPKEKASRCWSFIQDVGPLAAHIGALALRELRGGARPMVDTLKPIYVRLSDAELKERCRV